MRAPEWLVWLTLFISFVAAVVVSAIFRLRSAHAGDSIWREWSKDGIYGTLAMLAVWAAFFITFHIVATISD